MNTQTETKTKIETCVELSRELNGYIGSENFYQHFTRFGVYTDGVKAMAEKVGAHWLIDLIFSWQTQAKVKAEEFQVWVIKVDKTKTPMAVVEMRADKDAPIIASQKIEFTDFPDGEFKLWYTLNGIETPTGEIKRIGTLLLPSEY